MPEDTWHIWVRRNGKDITHGRRNGQKQKVKQSIKFINRKVFSHDFKKEARALLAMYEKMNGGKLPKGNFTIRCVSVKKVSKKRK